MHLGLIGYGSIARALMGVLVSQGAAPARVTVLARPGSDGAARAALARDFAGPGAVATDVAALIAARPDLVVELAGQAAVAALVPDVLAAGIETVIVSIGALADPALLATLEAAARQGATRISLPGGAMGGIDLLSALRPSGITSVVYTGRKPPLAWAGTLADGLLDLAALTEPATFFTGTARQAALDFPKNANVAATLALAGIGFDATEVRLIADPGVDRNLHEVAVTAGAADYTIRIAGHPAPDNPKTSATTALSVAREVMNRSRRVAI